MKGNKEFSEDDANQIRRLIDQKLVSSTSEQKGIRRKIRDLKFCFSDFSKTKGYTVEDFDDLVRTQRIKIIDNSTSSKPANYLEQKEELHISTFQNLKTSDGDIEKGLITNGDFKQYLDLNHEILGKNGFYCIRLKNKSKLPDRYQRILDKKDFKFIYIGKAEGQTLRKRLQQEIEHKKPGTFFRSIGCVLQYLPIKGHLKGNSNQYNYKFSPSDTNEIVKWLKSNTELSIVENTRSFEIEKKLIGKYSPLLNDAHNKLRLQELIDDKEECRKIARE